MSGVSFFSNHILVLISLINFETRKEDEWKIERWKFKKKKYGLRDGGELLKRRGNLENGGGVAGGLKLREEIGYFYIYL